MENNSTKYEKPRFLLFESKKSVILNNVDTVNPNPGETEDPDPTVTSERWGELNG